MLKQWIAWTRGGHTFSAVPFISEVEACRVVVLNELTFVYSLS